MILEGTRQSVAYLIQEGECRLESHIRPQETCVSREGRILILRAKKLVTNQGFITDTTSKFLIGIKCEKQWVGEDILVLGN